VFTVRVSDNVTCPRAADIILVLDQSTSIVHGEGGYDNWYVSMLGFAAGVVQAFPISPQLTQVGVLLFSHEVDPKFYLNTYHNKDDLINAIRGRYNPTHFLHYLLPKQTERSYVLRSRSHNFEVSCMHDDRNFIDRMLFSVFSVNVSSHNVCCFHCILSISSLLN